MRENVFNLITMDNKYTFCKKINKIILNMLYYFRVNIFCPCELLNHIMCLSSDQSSIIVYCHYFFLHINIVASH